MNSPMLQTESFFPIQSSDDVMHMTTRPDVNSNFIILALLFCVLLVSLARLRQREVFLILLQGSVLFRSHTEQLKDGVRQNAGSILLLIFQFICISSLSFFWINEQYLDKWNVFQQTTLLLFPFLVLLYTSVLSWLATRLTQTPKFFSELNYINLGLAQVNGLFFLVAFFVLFFKPEYKILGNLVILSTFAFFYILRVIRSFYIGIQQGITWYYIILYLWTLEILPVLILAKLLFNEEFSEIIG